MSRDARAPSVFYEHVNARWRNKWCVSIDPSRCIAFVSLSRVRSRVSLVAIVVVAVARIARAWPHRERDPNRATSCVSFDRHRAYKPSGARYVSDANACVSFLCVSRSRVSRVVVVAAVVVR